MRPGVHALLARLGDTPAFVLGRRTDILASNRMARALLTDFDAMPVRERNSVRWVLLDEAARSLFADPGSPSDEALTVLSAWAAEHPGADRTSGAPAPGENALHGRVTGT